MFSILIAFLFLSSFVAADDIYQIKDMPGGGVASWVTPEYWSGPAPSSTTANYYFVGEGATDVYSIRTIENQTSGSSDSFPYGNGNVLWLGYNMNQTVTSIKPWLGLKSWNVTITDLRVGNAVINHGLGNGTVNLDGAMTVGGMAQFHFSGNTASKINLKSSISGNGTITLSQGCNNDNLTISHANNSFTGTLNVSQNSSIVLSGANAMQNASSIIVDSGATLKLNNTQKLNHLSGSGTVSYSSNALTLNNTTNSVFSGTITGSGSVTKTGVGALTLTAVNAYTGITNIDAGTLTLSGAGNLTGTSSVSVASGATLEFTDNNSDGNGGAVTFNRVISGAGNLVKSGTGTVILSYVNQNDFNTYSGTTTISGGTLQITRKFTHSTALKGSGILELNGNWVEFAIEASDVTTPQEFDGTLNVLLPISIIRSDGSTQTLNLGNATLNVGSNGIVGLGYGNNDAVSNLIIKEINAVEGSRIRTSININAITKYGTLTVGRGVINGIIGSTDANHNNVNLVKVSDETTDGGTLTLSGANTYVGTTTIEAGTLKVTGAGTLGTGAVTNNATLEFNNTNNGVQITNTISGSGAIIKSGTGTVELTQALTGLTGNTTITGGGLTLSNTSAASTLHNLSGGCLEVDGANSDVFVNLTSNANLTLNNTEMTKFIGSISANNKTITKTGDGTLQIYTGALGMVDAQSLVVSSGELDFKGYMTGSITVGDTAPGVFSPGNSIGEATFGGDYILNDNGKLLLEIAGSNYTDNDILIVAGNIVLNAQDEIDGDIELALYGNALANGPFTFDVVIGANNSDDISGAIERAIVKNFDWPFSNIKVTQEGTISSSYGDVSDVKAYHIRGLADPNAVPEPSTWALLLLGAAGLLYVRKRTRK